MAEPDDLVPTILREMRRDIAARFDQVDKQFGDVRGDLAEQNRKLETIRQALKAETVFARYAALGVDDRLDEIEKRLNALETRS